MERDEFGNIGTLWLEEPSEYDKAGGMGGAYKAVVSVKFPGWLDPCEVELSKEDALRLAQALTEAAERAP